LDISHLSQTLLGNVQGIPWRVDPQRPGIEKPHVVEYRKTPPESQNLLVSLIERRASQHEELLREKGYPFP